MYRRGIKISNEYLNFHTNQQPKALLANEPKNRWIGGYVDSQTERNNYSDALKTVCAKQITSISIYFYIPGSIEENGLNATSGRELSPFWYKFK